MAADNRLLGTFDLTGIPPAPRGVPQIEVKFDIDQNGIVHVTAKDLGSGKEAHVEINETAGLTEDEIKRMQSDAEAHAEEDRKKFELAQARNEADSLIYQVEKTMKEHADKLQDSDRQPLEAAIEKVRKAMEGDNAESIKSATKELEQASHAFSKMMYEKTAAAGADADASPETEPVGATSDDDAIDAEFEVKND